MYSGWCIGHNLLKLSFNVNICIDFSNGGRPEKRTETIRHIHFGKKAPKIECLLHSDVLKMLI